MLDQHHQKLKNILKQDITQVYGRRGRSLYTQYQERHCQDLPGNTIISQEMINELMDINRNMTSSGPGNPGLQLGIQIDELIPDRPCRNTKVTIRKASSLWIYFTQELL